MWQKMLQVGSGGGSLDTFSTFDIKTDEDELAGQEVVISFQDPSYIIASVRFSNIRSTDGLYHTPSVTVQSIGTYTFSCGTAKDVSYEISSFDMINKIEISLIIIRKSTFTVSRMHPYNNATTSTLIVTSDGKTIYNKTHDDPVYGSSQLTVSFSINDIPYTWISVGPDMYSISDTVTNNISKETSTQITNFGHLVYEPYTTSKTFTL